MKNTLKYVTIWVFFQWMQHLHCFRSTFFLTNRGKGSSSLNSISVSLLGSKVPVKSNANITSTAILGRLAKLGGEKDSSSIYQKNYADLWDEVPAENLQPIDFGHMQWTRGKNYYQIPDTAMLHVALNPERNSRAIELFYEIVKDRGNFITGEGEFKAYNTSAAYLLSHFRNTMQYHFAAEICNYFLHHLNNGEVKWKEEDFVIENKIIDRNYIPDRIFPTTLNLFGLPEKLSIKFKRIEEETKYNLCQHCSPNFYFIQQVARFLGRNAERFISGATFAYAFTEDYLKPTEESALEELLKEECKSFWKNKYDAFEVRKEKKNGKEQIQLISIRDKYGYNRAHVYAVDPPKGVKNGITTISIVIAGSPNPLSSSNAFKLWLGTNLGLNKRGASQKIAGKVVDCHAGIYRMFSQLYYGNKKNPDEMTIEKAVTKFIKETINTNDIEIRVSGHSLGGAIAQMLALDFNCSKFDRVRELYCVTLNAPPVFTKVPQLKYPQKVQLVHFYHHYDPVVNVPKILFRNAGIQVPMSSENAVFRAFNFVFHNYTLPFEWFNKIDITPYKTYFLQPPHFSANRPVDNTRVDTVIE